jgi:cytochrome c biogenesis protein CcmG/thiol:disulfide interchange protein DsbE
MVKKIAPLALFIALAGLFLYMLTQMNRGEYNPRDVPSEFIGKPAPEFALPDLLEPNQMVSSSDFRGKPWLLNVWATWCPECWREHGYLNSLAKQRGIVIVGLNWRDELDKARQMLTELGNPFARVVVDKESDAVMDWGVYAAPETFLIDAEGVIRAKHKGAMNETVWQKKFAPHFETGT